MKLLPFLREFGDAETIVEKLRMRGLLTSSARCDVCGDGMICSAADNIDKMRFRCNKRTCRKEKTIRTGSFFERSKLPLTDCMLFLHLWAKGYSEKLIMDDFDFSKATVVDWSRFCRDLCVHHFEASNAVIGGQGSTVEIDETLAVKRKYDRGRLLRAGWLFGGIERRVDGQFRCFLRLVYDRSAPHLTYWIRQHVAPGTHIMTDGWGSYAGLSQMGYTHSVVNHQENFVSPEDEHTHTQTIEATWSSLKRFIRARGGNKGDYYLEYICEYVFRRTFPNTFYSLLDVVRQLYPIA